MKTIAIVFASICFVTAAFAEDSCKIQATGKNLHGAALKSFATKCCKDQATAQKLHGAAETSFSKKCGSAPTASNLNACRYEETGGTFVPPLRRRFFRHENIF